MEYSPKITYRSLHLNPRIGEWSFLGYDTRNLIKTPCKAIVNFFKKNSTKNLEQKTISNNL